MFGGGAETRLFSQTRTHICEYSFLAGEVTSMTYYHLLLLTSGYVGDQSQGQKPEPEPHEVQCLYKFSAHRLSKYGLKPNQDLQVYRVTSKS